MNKAVFNWSGGKDSALALHQVMSEKSFQVEALLTTINSHHERVTMHGVRQELIERQAEQIGIPLKKMLVPEQPSMEVYEEEMEKNFLQLKAKGITHALYGDIFLEDLRKYREDQLAKFGMTASFPLWKRDTTKLLKDFLDQGFKTVTVSAQARLGEDFVGKIIDHAFIDELPHDVDPCGENGEFHTFVFDGPLFQSPIPFEIGEKIYREYDTPNQDGEEKAGFWFCDLVIK